MSKLRRRFIPNFDSLETRVVPAGNVTVSFRNNLLSIVGDNEANGISITNNADGSFTVASIDDTTVGGGTDTTFNATRPFRVSINMRGGDDVVDIIGGNATIRANSSVRLGAGNDTLTVDGVFAQDDLKVDGESGDDTITITNGLVDEDARINGGAGSDFITIDNVAFDEDARIDGGSGDDFVAINNGRFNEDARIMGGSGIDDITISSSRFREDSRVDAGSGDDTVTIDDSVFFHDFRLEAGAGVDVVTITNSRFDYDSRFSLGSGSDEILLGGNFFNKEASFDGGSGFDTFTHDGTNTWAKKHKVKSFELFQLGEVTPPVGGVVANNDTATVAPLGSVTFDVVGNDVAPDGASLDLSTLTIVTAPTNGTAVANADGSITYTNTSGVAGTDTLTYIITDDLGNVSNEATVTITIATGGGGTLTGNPDTANVNAGGSTTINVLANDITPAGTSFDPASVQITLLPTHGTATVNTTTGVITYTHTPGDTAATDTFQYVVSNTAGNTSSPATVTVNINQPLAAINDTGVVSEGGSTTINLIANDTTPTGSSINPASIIITTPPTNGTVIVNGDGTVTFTHNGTDTTSATFQYTVANNLGNTSTPGTVNITVIPVNDAPVANADTFNVVRGTSQNLVLITNDTDPEGQLDPASIVIGTQPTQGTVTVNADGSVTYFSTAGTVAATDSFTYSIRDQSGLTSNFATVTINLT